MPRTSVLSPFDNLLFQRDRLRRLFGFDFVHENYVPRVLRRYGTYVLPILRGARFLGRVDPRFDRAEGKLRILAVHAEPDALRDRTAAEDVRAGLRDSRSSWGPPRWSTPTAYPVRGGATSAEPRSPGPRRGAPGRAHPFRDATRCRNFDNAASNAPGAERFST